MANPWDNDPVVGGKTSSPEEFAQVYGDAAVSAGKQLGVDPSVILGQWGHETGWGKSIVPGTANLGNIKDFSGGGTTAVDNATGSTDKYRNYSDPNDFVSDYVNLVKSNYPNATGTGADAAKFAAGLKGYAQDPAYADRIVAASHTAGAASQPWQNDPVVGDVSASQAQAAPYKEAPFVDETHNPNYKPDPNMMRVDIAGTADTPSTAPDAGKSTVPPTSQIADFGSALGHHLLNGLHGGAQLIEHGIAGAADKIAPDSAVAQYIRSQVNNDDTALATREQQYQATTPDSAGAMAGATVGEILPAYFAGGAKLIAGGADLAKSGIAALTANKAAQSLGALAGASAGSAGAGAAYSALQPVIPTPDSPDYAQNKLDQVKQGAIIGAALPVVGNALQGAGRYAGNVAGSFIKPFTEAGQADIAGNIISKFAKGGPTAVNAAEIVPGSSPTLAQATENSGLATLERGLRDVNPNAFRAREAAQNNARNAAFDDAAGDSSKLDFFRADRAATADNLYGQAIANYTGQTTPYIKGQITQLLKRPSIDEASKVAQKWAIERGEKPSQFGSLASLHDVKTALDDKIAKAVQDNAGGEAKALQATKDKLVQVMDTLSPEYAQARANYAAMSQPVNAMETLQGLKLTDAKGNMTLQKVQTAIRSLQDRINAPGIDKAKSLTANQLGVLTSIRDDLLRQTNSGLGRSIGSNTFQNIATNNILGNLLPGPLETLSSKLGVSGVVGSVGNYLYKGSNEAIKNRLLQMHMDPASAAPYINGNASAAAKAIPGASVNRLAPYLLPATAVTGSLTNSLNQPR